MCSLGWDGGDLRVPSVVISLPAEAYGIGWPVCANDFDAFFLRSAPNRRGSLVELAVIFGLQLSSLPVAVHRV